VGLGVLAALVASAGLSSKAWVTRTMGSAIGASDGPSGKCYFRLKFAPTVVFRP
jgi:hypothetical protein